MVSIHLTSARRHDELVRHPDGSISWVEIPRLGIARRVDRLNGAQQGRKAGPRLDDLPLNVQSQIYEDLMQHPTGAFLIPVSKEHADGFRNAPTVIAELAALEQEMHSLRDKRRQTRSEKARFWEAGSLLSSKSRKAYDSRVLAGMAYRFFDSPLLHINGRIRESAQDALILNNSITIRPQVHWNKHYKWWIDEGCGINLVFDKLGDKILMDCPRIDVIIHWFCIPVLQRLLVLRGSFGTYRPLLSLQITLVGKIHNLHDARSYINLLKSISARQARITWFPGHFSLSGNPQLPDREVTWPVLQPLFDEAVNVMQAGGLSAANKGTVFEPFPTM